MTDSTYATAWQEYLAAAQRLDAARRESASTVAAGTRTVSTARVELGQVRQRLARQRGELVDAAARSGRARRLRLAATDSELKDAGALVDGDPAAVRDALRHCRHLLDSADNHLSGRRTGRMRVRGRVLAATALACGLLAAVLVLADLGLTWVS